MNILGISCFYHDSAACLVVDGKIVAAVQEERFNRSKYSSVFPINAINFCIQKGDITIYDIDYVVFYEKPYLKFSRVVLNHLKSYPFSLKNFLDTTPGWLQHRLATSLFIKKELGFKGEVLFLKHHLSHAASSFLSSPFKNAAILTADGVGEYASLTYGLGVENEIKILKEIHFPDSLGLLYTAVTTFLGFKALQGEGKVMGLAGYGKPRYVNDFGEILTVKADGSFRLDDSFFGFNKGSRMYSRKFTKKFGNARKSEEKIEPRHQDMAATVQKILEDALIKIAKHVYSETKLDNLCLAGGVFLNCVLNSKIIECTPFKKIFIQPAAGDAGGALGAATYVYHSVLKNPRSFILQDVYLGPDFTDRQMKTALLKNNLQFKEYNDYDLIEYVAKEISKDKIIGWFQGRMEFGPRGLGNRSILANPCSLKIRDMMNKKVKKREAFRPYAPSVLEERANDFFISKQFSYFMLIAAKVKESKKNLIPAVTHIDGTARVQIVSRSRSLKFWQLIKEFENITRIPVVLNTSFNLIGEPIVCTPEDAISTFKRSEMDYLVLNNFLVSKYKKV